MCITKSAVTVAGDHRLLASLHKVGDQLCLVIHLGAHWHTNDQALAAVAAFVALGASPAWLGLELLLVAEMQQGIEVLISLKYHIAAAAAIAAVRATTINIFLMPKTDRAIAAVACLHSHNHFVYEHSSYYSVPQTTTFLLTTIVFYSIMMPTHSSEEARLLGKKDMAKELVR